MEENDVVYLWRNKLWYHIIFFECIVLSKNTNFSKWNLDQKFQFYGCEFKEGLPQNREEKDFISKVTNAISDIWMLSKNRYSTIGTGWDLNMFDEVCIARKTRSLFFNILIY